MTTMATSALRTELLAQSSRTHQLLTGSPERVDKTCGHCGKTFSVKPCHAEKRVNCSVECMAAVYAKKLVGKANPNYKAKEKSCKNCGKEFLNYAKTSAFCCHPCYIAWGKANKPPRPVAVKKRRPPILKNKACERCGEEFLGSGDKRFCDECRHLGRRVPHKKRGMSPATVEKYSKTCHHCGKGFLRPNDSAKYCTYGCFVSDGGPNRAGEAATMSRRRRGAHKEDFNHAKITGAFEQMGAVVMNFAMVGGGCPDILVIRGGRGVFVEIKNPDTAYGRRGLNKNQLRKQQELAATGCKMHVVRTEEDVEKIMNDWVNSSNLMG
jgi:hypothetical protein